MNQKNVKQNEKQEGSTLQNLEACGGFFKSIEQLEKESLSQYNKICPSKYLGTRVDVQYRDTLPFWLFGNIHKPIDSKDSLHGILRVNKKYGFIEFISDNSQLRCIVINNVEHLLNSIVLIWDFRIITEHYPNRNLEYLIFDSNNAITTAPINAPQEPSKLVNKRPLESLFKLNSTITIIAISNVMLNVNNQREFWLKVENLKSADQFFLCLGENFIPVWQKFKVLNIYTVYYNESFARTYNREISYVDSNCKQYKLKDGLFYDHDTQYRKEEILTVSECKLRMEQLANNPKKFLSFKGFLIEKEFKGLQASRTFRKANDNNFGVPDNSRDGSIRLTDNTSYIALYINNWESILLPIGLLPNTELIIRNVVNQKGAYLKCSSFTTFTVTEYKNSFHGCSLDRFNWGDEPLAIAVPMPQNAIVWKRVSYLKWENFIISPTTNDFNQCFLNVSIIFFTFDFFNKSKIIINGPIAEKLLKMIIQLDGENYKSWCLYFVEKTKYYNFEKYNNNYEINNFFTQCLEVFCQPFDIKCYRENDKSIPTYQVIDIRESLF